MGIDYEKTFGFKPGSIGNRYRYHWVITEPDEDDERAGAKSGCLCVRARDGASNPIDAEACKHPNFIGTVEDDFDRTYRYYYYRPLTDADRDDPTATIAALRKRVEELEGAANDEREWLKKQVFALCEDTTEKYHDAGQRDTEGKEGAFARGRCIEAKSIARAIGDVCHERARAALRAKGGEHGVS